MEEIINTCEYYKICESACGGTLEDTELCSCYQLYKEIKSLYEEKNCLHKIIDRLLENSGYSKDIASAEDFEDVYEDMQTKRNELIELEQENAKLKEILSQQQELDNEIEALSNEDKYKQALEEINILAKNYCNACDEFKVKTFKNKNDCLYCNYGFIKRKINEVLQ